MPEPLPDAAITAAVRAYNESYLTGNQSNPRFVEKVVAAVVAAAAPALRAQGAAAERARITARARQCTECGKPHACRKVPPGSPFRFNGRTWADPDDGHAYAPRFDIPNGSYDRKLADLLHGDGDG